MSQEGDTQMEWKPSPGCKVLFENLPLWYLIGNTRGRNLLESSPGESPSAKSLLLLGCGDIRNVFFTVAAAHATAFPLRKDEKGYHREGEPSVSDEAPTGESGTCHLEFHLNDWNPIVLARAVLFLTLARHLDVSLVEDMNLFWSLWCHLALTQRQLTRLQEAFSALAATDFSLESGHMVIIPKEEDVMMLKSIWTSWALCKDIPSVEKVVVMRKEKVMKHFSGTTPSTDTKEVCDGSNHIMARCMCEGSFMDRTKMEDMQPVIEKEAMNWNETGMTGMLADPKTGSGHVANPTLLDPVSWEWNVHYAVNPFVGFMPLPPGCLQQPMGKKVRKEREAFPLSAACKGILREQLACFKAYSAKRGLRFHIWGSDALQLALYDLPSRKPPSKEEAAPNEADLDGDTRMSHCFDIIDTSNLGDHVGLLNLLTCCAPLLKSPSSRLITATILWSSSAPSLFSYLQRAIGTPHLSILPTLLGLRLAFDLQFDTLNPLLDRIPFLGATHMKERLVSWCLVGNHPLHRSSSTSPVLVPSPTSLSLLPRKGKNVSSQITRKVNSSVTASPLSHAVGTCRYPELITLLPTTLTSSQIPLAQIELLQETPSPCAITSALHEIVKICCKPRGWSLEGHVMARRSRCGLHHSSPLTLCLILWNLSNRLSPSSVRELSWEALLGNVPSQAPGFTLTLKAMWQHLRGLRGGWPSVGYEAALGCGSGSQKGVMVYRRKLGIEFFVGMKIVMVGTPQLRVLLVECLERLPNGYNMGEIITQALTSGRVRGGYRFHIIDNIQMDTKTTELVFSLPSDHGLNKDRVLVALGETEGMPIGLPLPLSAYEEEYVPEPVWGAASHKAFESERLRGERKEKSMGVVEGGMEVVCVVEYGGAFECVVGIEVGAEGAVSVEGMEEERLHDQTGKIEGGGGAAMAGGPDS